MCSRSVQAYFSAASELHATQIKALLSAYGAMVKKAPVEEEVDGRGIYHGIILCSFSVLPTGFSGTTPTSNASKAAQGMRRAGTIVRSPLDRREKKEASDGEIRATEVIMTTRFVIYLAETGVGLEHGTRATRTDNLCRRELDRTIPANG